VPTLGMGELLIILVIVLLIFGASRLPQIGEGIGKAVRNLKRGLSTDEDIDVTPSERRVEKQSSARSVKDEENVTEAEVVEKS